MTTTHPDPNGGRKAYAAPIDAIVMAGTHRNARRLISGRNKAFLDVGGRPLVRHVVDALTGARHVDSVYVVGPEDELQPLLADCPRTTLVPQEGKLLSNAWAAVRAVEADHADLEPERLAERPILLISCDLPLVSPGAIDDFVERAAAMDRQATAGHAMLVGIAEDAALRPFYSDDMGPGMERPLVQMREGLYRLSNIYVARPRKLEHSEFLQTSFTLRKAKDWHNVVKLVFSLFSQHGGWFAAWMTCRLQLTAMLRKGKGRLYRRLRAGNTFEKIEQGVSTVLGGSVRLVDSPYGGLSLDIDDEVDFDLLAERWADWTRVGEDLDRAAGRAPGQTPYSSASDSGGQKAITSTTASSPKKKGRVER